MGFIDACEVPIGSILMELFCFDMVLAQKLVQSEFKHWPMLQFIEVGLRSLQHCIKNGIMRASKLYQKTNYRFYKQMHPLEINHDVIYSKYIYERETTLICDINKTSVHPKMSFV